LPNNSDQARVRRQHQLADGRDSLGYTPIERELFRAPISAEALGVLAHLRTDAIIAESDGLIEDRQLAAVVGFLGIKPARVRQILQELENAGAITSGPRGVTDVNYGCWCRSRAERKELRQEWVDRQRRARGNETVVSLPMSRGESRGESRGDATGDSR
jgi:hypothetical protein